MNHTPAPNPAARKALERKVLMIMVAMSVTELAAIVIALRRTRPIDAIHLMLHGTVAGWFAAFITAAAFVLATVTRFPSIRGNIFSLSSIKIIAIPAGLLAAIAEEIWFRKIPMDALARAHVGADIQLAVAALLFGWSTPFGDSLRVISSPRYRQ